MEQLKGGLLVASPAGGHTGPKLRKKLRKTVSKQRSTVSWRLGFSSSASTKNDQSETADKPPVLSLPSPDLSDPKWSEFFKNGGCFYPQDESVKPAQTSQTSVSLESSKPSQSPEASKPSLSEPSKALQPAESRDTLHEGQIVPELSHLVISDSDAQKRMSMCSNSEAPASPRTAMRRRAKTPIFSIGQLEGIPRPSNALARASTVELIAEQYRALLESDNTAREASHSESHSEPPPSRQERRLSIRRRQSSDHLRDESRAPRPVDAASGSPISDDGTLVSFEEETVYFKPVSFSPEPSPRPPPGSIANAPAPDNLSLQICLDLLTRDLASALASRPSRTNSETSALQVWVMIEAYERLRDQFGSAGLGCEEYGALEGMLNFWLRALYSIHDNLTGGDRYSESDYGEEP
ncbi:uncharacterized protein PODANS_4_8140 [Podospora anserina S mat+]|uniref:Podospora anserina S mat+ genomic DNA chromosome 4, supercontig 4 n=1 Tax=Podospora anserina (strain S / ATCC MYA-4624 / DSM 980 / FGSC 10383) TaxID=515849 RepID=B2ARA3_PODAN|nr:uncharacterized protein PODANS_4_8140 [Podospora anserina S mat+]CAP66681.1 unnamed protein product [Podospora anserina S mat+]CDP28416.1 Putative protein of unknown function [Podospora anserina S mat+]